MSGTASCRECGAEILFIPTPAGRMLPVNARPVWYHEDPEGPCWFWQRDGRHVRGRLVDGRSFATGSGYRSHFDTCRARRRTAKPPPERRESEAARQIRERIEQGRREAAERAAQAEAKARAEEELRDARRRQMSLW